MSVRRDYGTVVRLFWRDPRVKAAGNDARTLALYLLTAPTGSTEGFYPLESPLVMAHLGWSEKRLNAAWKALSWFATFDPVASVVFVHKALKYHAPAGRSQVAGAVKALDRAQDSPVLFWRFLAAAERYAPDFASAIRECYHIDPNAQPPDSALAEDSKEGVGEGVGEGVEAVFRTSIPNSTPTPSPSPPQLGSMSTGAEGANIAGEGRAAIAQRCFDYWRERCKKPAHTIFTTERRKKVLERLAEGRSEENIRQAIDGAAIAPTKSDDGRRTYDDLELICRNGTKFESFMERGSKPRDTAADFFARNAAAFAH